MIRSSRRSGWSYFLLLPFLGALAVSGEIRTFVERIDPAEATAGFEFSTVPRPATNDAATRATFRVVAGARDPNGGDLGVLSDGRVPANEDAPRQNFFFAPGSAGGRLLVDLQQALPIARIHTYSWHSGERGPQRYTVYAAAGTETGFTTEVGGIADPTTAGWSRLAAVDTRPKDSDSFGGQYGASIADSDPAADLGRFRYLLFAVDPTGTQGPFGQTFFSEIDVIDRNGPSPESVSATASGTNRRELSLDQGRTRIAIDSSAAPDLAAWVDEELVPVVRDWYPEICRLLPSEGFEPPRKVTIAFAAEGDGVAATSGTQVTCWAKWFRANLSTEAKGAVVHELVHVVQQYGRGRNRAAGASRPPGWLVEGIPDYIRWFRFEPRSGGALIPPSRADRVRYDGSYRISANFLNWVTVEYGPRVYRELNAAMREGRYREALWTDLTGHTPQELGDAWKADLARQRQP